MEHGFRDGGMSGAAKIAFLSGSKSDLQIVLPLSTHVVDRLKDSDICKQRSLRSVSISSMGHKQRPKGLVDAWLDKKPVKNVQLNHLYCIHLGKDIANTNIN